MKVNAVLALIPLALAAPTQLQKRLPDHTPVDVEGLDSDFTINCGKCVCTQFFIKQNLTFVGQVKVDGFDVHKAVSWGVNLQVAGETIGSGLPCRP